MTSVPAAAIVEQGLAGALREAHHQLQARFQNSKLPMFESDTSLHITAWNPAAERLLGYSQAEAIGQPVSFLVAPALRARVDTAWRTIDAPNEFIQECIDKHGRPRICHWYEAPLSAVNGTALGVSFVLVDLSERGRSEQADVRSHRLQALSRVADGVAHDFTNVFAVVLSYANFIKDSSPAGDPRHDDALEILLAAGEGTALIRRLLSVAERFTGEKPIELNESLLQLRPLLLRSLGEYRELQLIESQCPLLVYTDPVRLDQLMLSLSLAASETVSNRYALQIALEKSVEPSAGSLRPTVRITIQCVERSSPWSTPPSEGQPRAELLARPGPEIAACLRDVEAMGGTLEVRENAALGTAFVVELPLWIESPSAAPPQVEGGQQQLSVLIAEGEAALGRAAARALSQAGYDVQVATDYDTAVASIKQLGARLDVLITDLAMPGCEQYELVVEARRVAPGARALSMAAFAREHESAASPEGIVCLYKPLQPGELVAAVRGVLSKREFPGPTDGGQGELVLVVEDDDAMRTALVRILECAGYRVCQAAKLGDARQHFEGGIEPGLVLCDLSLPDGSGVELMNWILTTRPALLGRVFVLSGGAVEEADVAFVRRGLVPVLKKPIEPGPLLQILGRARADSRGNA
jgi:two-component system, cell cycle sensor histidine kinase and response regulator CckA